MEVEMKKEFGETNVLHQFWNNDHGFWGGYRGETVVTIWLYINLKSRINIKP